MPDESPFPIQHFFVGNRVREWGFLYIFDEPNLGTVVEINFDGRPFQYKIVWDTEHSYKGKESWETYQSFNKSRMKNLLNVLNI